LGDRIKRHSALFLQCFAITEREAEEQEYFIPRVSFSYETYQTYFPFFLFLIGARQINPFVSTSQARPRKTAKIGGKGSILWLRRKSLY